MSQKLTDLLANISAPGAFAARTTAAPGALRLEVRGVAKPKRGHVHGIIEEHAFPVTHKTRRTGRPFTLVLEKTEALFETEAAERKTWQRELSWLTKNRRSF